MPHMSGNMAYRAMVSTLNNTNRAKLRKKKIYVKTFIVSEISAYG